MALKKNNPGCNCCATCFDDRPRFITDNFNRPDETPVGAPWETAVGTVNLISNQLECNFNTSSVQIHLAPFPLGTATLHAEIIYMGASGTSPFSVAAIELDNPFITNIGISVRDAASPGLTKDFQTFWPGHNLFASHAVPATPKGLFFMEIDIVFVGGAYDTVDIDLKCNGVVIDSVNSLALGNPDEAESWCETRVLIGASNDIFGEVAYLDDFDARFAV